MTRSMRAVVIGTGAGGLGAAAYLAKKGFEVTALERAKHLGGFMNPFSRKGYDFDPGIHYVGECRPGQSLYRFLEGLELSPEDLFCELDPDGFDRYRFPDVEVAMCRGADRYRERLTALFPRERTGLERFFALLRRLSETGRRLSALSGRRPRLGDLTLLRDAAPLARWVRTPYKSVLDWAFDDPLLKGVLAAPCGDYGLPPGRASALYALGLIGHYTDGAYYPRGGGRHLRDALVRRARALGATFHRRTEAAKILMEGSRAVGVQDVSGEVFPADVVVSAIDPAHTYGGLLPQGALPRRLLRKVRRLEPSISSLIVFLGMRRDLRAHGLGAHNVWDYPTADLDSLYEPLFRGEMPKAPFLFLSPNSLKDDSGRTAPEGASTLEIVTGAPYRPFARWDGRRRGHRGQAYLDLKRRTADAVLERVDARYPGLVGDVEVQEIGTPVTVTWYVNSVAGGIYGPAATPGQSLLFRFSPTTPVPNVFLAGSGVLGGGIAPSLMSGRLAARLAASALESERNGISRSWAGSRPRPAAG